MASVSDEEGARKDVTAIAASDNGPVGRQANADRVKELVSSYVQQMLYGCGNSDCRELLCENGRQNTSGRPLRRPTPRSARMMALTLASGPRPRSRLCRKSDIRASQSERAPESGATEGPRDHASVAQLLADSEPVTRLSHRPKLETPERQHQVAVQSRSNPEHAVDQIRAGHLLLDAADGLMSLPNVHEYENDNHQRILEAVCEVLRILVASFPPARGHSLEISTLIFIDIQVRSGQIQLQRAPKLNGWYDPKMLTEHMDILTDPMRLRLLQRALLFVARLTRMELLMRTGADGSPAPATFNSEELEELYVDGRPYMHFVDWLSDVRHKIPGHIRVFWAWIKVLFLQEWDGSPFLEVGQVPFTCLMFLSMCKDAQLFGPEWEAKDDERNPYTIEDISNQVDDMTMAQSWLDFQAIKSSPSWSHLLQNSAHINPTQLSVYFRTVNHLRMRQAHSDAEKASNLRGRTVQNTHDIEADSRLVFLEDHYLLISVGRSKVLEDSLNQLWQRRSGELLRPLRVRLGEMDTFEVGHDLGGVQIEFFNLVCKEVLSDELGMFTSEPGSGCSYFRPGSLQPLYMFELLGLLFGLAIFNGITLPVSFPLIFYRKLGAMERHDDMTYLQDGWPQMYKSLQAILENDVPGLSYVFMMEANGVRLSISSVVQEPERETPKVTARVLDATGIVHHPASPAKPEPQDTANHGVPSAGIDITALSWPGWSFEPSPPDDPDEVTPENKHRYVDEYIAFLTHTSVAAQWDHFLKGFHRVMPSVHLSFFTPRQLRSLVEGTQHLSIADLRSITVYEGYMPHGPYISCFWSVVESWPEEKQKRLLKFVTAAERLPAGGARDVVFKIARVSHPDAEQGLPTSSTCFGTLNLPKYASRGVLEGKLGIALEMGLEGFGTG